MTEITPHRQARIERVLRSRRLQQRAFLAESFSKHAASNRKKHSREHRFLVIGVVLIIAVTVIGTASLIHFGSKPREDYWATVQTIEAKPSIEIRP